MRVLIVASANSKSFRGVSHFVKEQIRALVENGIDVELFPIEGKGWTGYLKAWYKLRLHLKRNDFDILHANYFLSGLICVFQKNVKKVVSFIGCDINIRRNNFISRKIIIPRTDASVFVSHKLQVLAGSPINSSVVPFGIDLMKFTPVEMSEARKRLGWEQDHLYVFFASRFDRAEKNAPLALEAIKIIENKGIKCTLVEFKDIPENELIYYYNACNVFLLTSIREGSPQSIKEALACNTPVVATNVGDISELINGLEGCSVVPFDPEVIATNILSLSSIDRHILTGRLRLSDRKLDNASYAERLISIYSSLVSH